MSCRPLFVSLLEQNLLESLECFVPFFFFCRNINCCHCMMTYYQICSRILSARTSDRRFEKLLVKKDSSSTESSSQLFVDNAVYSRNRCFRLALSSKAGKTSVLLPMGRLKCEDMVWYLPSQDFIFT